MIADNATAKWTRRVCRAAKGRRQRRMTTRVGSIAFKAPMHGRGETTYTFNTLHAVGMSSKVHDKIISIVSQPNHSMEIP